MERESKVSHTVTEGHAPSEHSALIAIWHLNTTACNREEKAAASAGLFSDIPGTFFGWGKKRWKCHVHREDAEALLVPPCMKCVCHPGDLFELSLAISHIHSQKSGPSKEGPVHLNRVCRRVLLSVSGMEQVLYKQAKLLQRATRIVPTSGKKHTNMVFS